MASLAFSPDGRRLASGSIDETIRLWDVVTGKELLQIRGHGKGGVAFSPDGKIIASGGGDKTICLWDVSTGKRVRQIKITDMPPPHPKGAIALCIAFSPDGKRIAAGCIDGTIGLWDATTGEELHRLDWSVTSVCTVAFSPDGKTLAAGRHRQGISFWDVASGQLLRYFEGHRGAANSVAFSPDGRMLASGSFDRSIGLWDVATGRQLHRFEGHQAQILSVAFSPDGRMLASGSEDKTVRLWEVASGKERCRLKGHQGQVFAVDFSPDGKALASGSGDMTILLWDLAGRGKAGGLTPRELDSLWADLAGGTSEAYRAICTLVANHGQALPFLEKRLKGAVSADPQRIKQLIADLDGSQFSVRERAMAELEMIGGPAEAALRRVLAGKPSPELRRRAERLLDKLSGPIVRSPELLRTRRALEVLEAIGNPEARRLLQTIATKGETALRVAEEAQTSLRRLERRPAVQPK